MRVYAKLCQNQTQASGFIARHANYYTTKMFTHATAFNNFTMN